MTEHGLPDNRLNRNRTMGKSHQLPAGYKPTPDSRHNITKAKVAAAEATAEAKAKEPTPASRPAGATARTPASTRVKAPATTGSRHTAGRGGASKPKL